MHIPQDFFYVCLGHLKDRGFALPIINEKEAAEKKRKEELEQEIERVKREYEEKQQKKEEKKGGKDKNTSKKDKASNEKEKEEGDKVGLAAAP